MCSLQNRYTHFVNDDFRKKSDPTHGAWGRKEAVHLGGRLSRLDATLDELVGAATVDDLVGTSAADHVVGDEDDLERRALPVDRCQVSADCDLSHGVVPFMVGRHAQSNILQTKRRA